MVHNVPWQVGKEGILSPEGAEPWVEELAKGCAHHLALPVCIQTFLQLTGLDSAVLDTTLIISWVGQKQSLFPPSLT